MKNLTFLSTCLCLTASIALASVNANAVPAPQTKLKSLQMEEKSLREARKEVLDSLYRQLSQTKNSDSANLIVSAIDRIWSQSGSDTADLLMGRAKLAMQRKDYDLAISLLKAIGEIDPRFTGAWNQLATVYYLQDRYTDAMTGLRRVLALDPNHFKAIEGLAIIMREIGKKEAALKIIRRALEIHPHLESAKQAEKELEHEVEGQRI